MRKTEETRPSIFLSRAEIIGDIGKAEYNNAVKRGDFVPIRFGEKKNCKQRIPREQYERYILRLTSNNQ